ncbi:hypothetical protein [Shewanella algae]|uniref:hypothetical protein n=1 Tax=Shewanella algae TaxID=38313 RepID=UPI0011822993|nr:hypothetical protein [Shewanella algae]TVO82166.1 hypothetical protein AYI76_15305 [Shewanella algae]TVO83304.1 hypothetical protein AYI78_13560 [Shewanella algae]TVO87693.1 hypothetical protein AYI80_14525 [Shewanella algae]TVO94618.1 hypothetical protein AYI79_13050 [Shewanella algae]TXS85022.1 hypothetical protein AYI81_17095 [Shewanella algae]
MKEKIFPLLVMILGAASLFFSNIFARSTFTEADFIIWSYTITITSIFFSFSALGTEQLLIRFGSFDTGMNLFRVSNSTFVVFLAGSIFFLFIYYFFLNGVILNIELDFLDVFLLSLLVSIIQFFYQARRGCNEFLVGQVYYNLWRVIVFLFVISYSFFELNVVDLILSSLFLNLLVCIFIKQSSVKISRDKLSYRKNITLAFSMLSALFIMTILNTYDKILVDNFSSSFDVSFSFADYFYFVSIFVTPFTILSSYFGYTESKVFKAGFNKSYFINRSLLIFIFSLLACLIWAFVLDNLKDFIGLPTVSFQTFFIVILIASIRCTYGIASSAMGICGTNKQINLSTFIFFVSFGLVVLFISLKKNMSINIVLFSFLFLWLVRYSSYTIILLRGGHVKERDD